jgi:hypothetical protein
VGDKRDLPAKLQFCMAYRARRIRERHEAEVSALINDLFPAWELSGVAVPSDLDDGCRTNAATDMSEAADYAFKHAFSAAAKPGRILEKQKRAKRRTDKLAASRTST